MISEKKYPEAWDIADRHRRQMIADRYDAPLFELTFLTGLCEYHLGKKTEAIRHFKDTLYAAYAIESPYAVICRDYILSHTLMELPENLRNAPDIPLQYFPIKKIIDYSDFSDGIYDFYGADAITIGSLIHESRIRQKISLQVLSQGLCSISKLSKIEKGSLIPDVILAETLLQRLGISEREFIFWGNTKEARLYEIKYKLLRNDYLPDDDQKKLLAELRQLISEKDTIPRQYLLYEEHYLVDDAEKKISLLKEALHLTLKDFDINKITDYRLSWLELTILNSIAIEYLYTAAPHLGIHYCNQILAYHREVQTDCIYQSQTLAVTHHFLFRLLYNQGYYKTLLDRYAKDDLSITKYSLLRCSMIYFYYSQSLGECRRFKEIPLPACYSCGISNILEDFDNSTILKHSLLEDFSININF